MILKNLVFLIVFFSSIVFSENNVQQIIELAREYRCNPNLDLIEEDSRKMKIVEKAESCLLTYGKHDSLKDAVKKFVHDNVPHRKFQIYNAVSCNLAGTTEDAVFLVFEDCRLAYAVKAFKNIETRRGKFLTELSALDFVVQLKLHSSSPIYALAVASCECANESYVLLLETAAQGERLDRLVRNIGEAKELETRTYWLKLAKDAYEQAGRALAELHSTKSEKIHSIPSKAVNKMRESKKIVLENPVIIEAIKAKSSLKSFKHYLEKSLEEALKHKIHYTFAHGDAHAENIFYENEDNQIYFIDLVRLHSSVTLFHEPMQDGIIDLIQMEDNLKKMAVTLLTEGEVQLLRKSFFNAYKDAGGILPHKRHVRFYRNYFFLRRLMSTADNLKDSNSAAIFNMALQYFVEQIRLAQEQALK